MWEVVLRLPSMARAGHDSSRGALSPPDPRRTLPPQESDLVDQVRQALETGRFDELFAAGTRLSQAEVVAAATADAEPTDPHRAELDAVRTEHAGS
jgi:hypothetical protein